MVVYGLVIITVFAAAEPSHAYARDPRKAASLCAGIRGVGADAAADEEANAGRLLGALDMTPLYRAHHICQTLGKGAWFQGSYLVTPFPSPPMPQTHSTATA